MYAKSGLIYEKAKKGGKTNEKAMGGEEEGKNQEKEGENTNFQGNIFLILKIKLMHF